MGFAEQSEAEWRGIKYKIACEDRPHMSVGFWIILGGEKPTLSTAHVYARRRSCGTNCGEEGRGIQQPVREEECEKEQNIEGRSAYPRKLGEQSKQAEITKSRCACGRQADRRAEMPTQQEGSGDSLAILICIRVHQCRIE